jgi:hypothetical protein
MQETLFGKRDMIVAHAFIFQASESDYDKLELFNGSTVPQEAQSGHRLLVHCSN